MTAAPDSIASETRSRSRYGQGPAWVTDIVLAVVVVLVYAGAVATSYGFLDDYPILAGVIQRDGAFRAINQSMGRPVAGWIMDNSFSLAGSVANLRWLRLAAVLGFGVVAIVMRRIAARAGWDRWSACCIALLFVTLPSVQVYISWTTLWFYPYIICLVAGALLLLDAGNGGTGRGLHRILVTAALATAVLILVGLTYQPMMFLYIPLFMLRYWAAPVCERKAGRSQIFLKTAALHGTCLVLAVGICFCVYKLGAHPAPRGAFPTHWLDKAKWFVSQPLVYAFNLINIRIYSYPMAYIIAAIVAIVSCGGAMRAAWRLGPGYSAVGRAMLLPAAIVASYTPSLIVVENWPTFRSGYSLYCMTLVGFIWGLYNIVSVFAGRPQRIWRVISGGLAVLACVLALEQTYTLIARPQHAEYEVLTGQLAKLPLKVGDRVLFLQPYGNDSHTRIQLFEEFGIPSSSTSWVPVTMFWLALRETHPEITSDPRYLTLTLTQELPTAIDADYVVDMKTTLPKFGP